MYVQTRGMDCLGIEKRHYTLKIYQSRTNRISSICKHYFKSSFLSNKNVLLNNLLKMLFPFLYSPTGLFVITAPHIHIFNLKYVNVELIFLELRNHQCKKKSKFLDDGETH